MSQLIEKFAWYIDPAIDLFGLKQIIGIIQDLIWLESGYFADSCVISHGVDPIQHWGLMNGLTRFEDLYVIFITPQMKQCYKSTLVNND